MTSPLRASLLWVLPLSLVACGGPAAPVTTAPPSAAAHGDGATAPPPEGSPVETSSFQEEHQEAPAAAAASPEAPSAPAAESPKSADVQLPGGTWVDARYASVGAELPKGTMVLHIGDSFAGALGVDLNKALRERGLRSALEFQTATYIPTWAGSSELPKFLDRYQPDLVLITLGANELEITEPAQRAPTVRRLVKRLGDRPCVWIAPPLWGGKYNGLLEIIRDNAAPCRFMDSNAIIRQMPRAGDHIHPSQAARKDWAQIVLSWLSQERAAQGARPWEFKASPMTPSAPASSVSASAGSP